MRTIKFPRDEQAHGKIIEWWYYNGHLWDESGRQYAFMDCLFRADARKVKLPFFKAPLKTLYFSHSILSDIDQQRFYPVVDYVSLPSRQSFKRPLLFAEYISADPVDIFKGYFVNLIKEKKLFEYRLKTENFDLKLTARKKPLLIGGSGFLDLHGRQTYYYSLTDLAVEGEIYLPAKTVAVHGQAWMDHQWADAPYKKDRWTWFSLQLENKTEIVCFEYGDEVRDSLASVSYPGNKQKNFKNVKITPLGATWKSLRTKAEYELSWRIEIPEAKAVLEVEPLIKKQEMLFGTLNYWEGPILVRGLFEGKKVRGLGFLELVGRPAHFGLVDLLKATLSRTVKLIRDRE